MGVSGDGGEIGAVLCLGGRERPRLYRETRPNKVNFSLVKCERGALPARLSEVATRHREWALCHIGVQLPLRSVALHYVLSSP